MFEGQPKGLYALALANTGERFGYYTMLAVFLLFLQDNFGLSVASSGYIYSSFLMLVYFLPLVGGMLADKFGFGRMVTVGISIMFLGYLLLSIPLGAGIPAYVALFGALLLICFGTGLFKGNLQVMVGDLYNAPELQSKRDSAFSIFYMAINIGALFAPTAAVRIMQYAQDSLGYAKGDSYHFAFAVACLSLIVSILIYYGFRSTFRHVEGNQKKDALKDASAAAPVEELSAKETKERILALCFVFAVVIFFWMAFHQNGLTLTQFAKDYTVRSTSGVESMMFDVTNLVAVIFVIYALFSLFSAKTNVGRLTCVGVMALAGVYLGWNYGTLPAETLIEAPIFQQFNPCFVVALTPVSVALFGWLAKKGKEPSAPRKIGLGMLVAALGYVIMCCGSLNLLAPAEQTAAIEAGNAAFVSVNWLVSTYLVLTFAELLLSPMGISFVSKVAPPKYKGMMMGGWFVATALGNLLTSVGSSVWDVLPLWGTWCVFIAVCLLAAAFIFALMKRLEKVA